MSGFVGGAPCITRTIEVGKITVVLTMYADILNAIDSDVSFAYVWCGSMGSDTEAKESALRGKEKARFSDLPDTIEVPDVVSKWLNMLKSLKGTLNVWIGDDGHRGIFLLGDGRCDFDMKGCDVILDQGEFSVAERLLFDAKIRVWLKKAQVKIEKACKLQRRIDQLGVTGCDY